MFKTGYGNERIYRKGYKIINEPTFNSSEHLFLIEFSDVGREKGLEKNTYKNI